MSPRDIMCNGHRFVKSTLFQTPGYLADLSPYISAVISSRLFATPIQITASAIKPLGPIATSILPARATNYILSGTLTCEYCLHQVGQDAFDDGRICPIMLLEKLNISSDSQFVLAEQLIEAQERRAINEQRNPIDKHFYDEDLLIMNICPEIGLHAQGFSCNDCDHEIDLNSSRLCHYDGRYYCCQCHTGSDLAPIPARVLQSWDFTPKPVSRMSMQKICFSRTRPVLFNLFQINSMLYGFIDRLVEIKQAREAVQSMLKYLEVCGQPNRPNLASVPRHFLEANLLNYFTLNDLLDINQVYDQLIQLQTILERHILKECESCRGKGYYCELCKDPHDVLYPFSKTGASCQKCHTVYHKNCFHRKKKNCPRCVRLSAKSRQSLSSSAASIDTQAIMATDDDDGELPSKHKISFDDSKNENSLESDNDIQVDDSGQT